MASRSSADAFDRKSGTPACQAGAGGVGAFGKAENRLARRRARADVLVKESELAELRAPGGLGRLDRLVLDPVRLGIRVRKECGLRKARMARPEPAAHLLGVAAQSLDDPGARWRRNRTAIESRVGEVKGAPEKVHRRMAAPKPRTMLFDPHLDLTQHPPTPL